MLLQIRAAELDEPVREHRFHSKRRWRFDFAWLDKLVALEVDGGTYMRRPTGHTSPAGYRAGCEKANEAGIMGWLVLRVDSKMVKDGSALRYVERALERKAA